MRFFCFCGTRSDRFKALYWDKTGFVLYYKRIENGRFQWPRNQSEVKKINAHQFAQTLGRIFRRGKENHSSL
ncbi:IS66 family insertion sequence element accessory protein TnpB [Ligilactobacillus ruminis]|nr:IS66 family insertion sequence element accessory protein TnpB [Ligilactobacillus ruminis]